ncbi:hypothetical protein [Psychroflexus sediminis]|uniref:Uncharacterized protein n=1 Tax=Psychroflexus sediminis TaxID=470826 RepID=A0A1G7WB13_9FLAO|nr:hypothetical protein [Psychroflexus sediminis]SDG68290.1 hypothetical protein SAMN04488027_10564 [Psychroflexus sediminis]
MNTEKDYLRDLTEIRSLMERSSKFLSLTGFSGILAGVYALAGAYLACSWIYGSDTEANVLSIFSLGALVLVLALSTAVVLSQKKSAKNGERLWNPVAKRLLMNLAIPLVSGGIFILILFLKDSIELIAPAMLIFYGLALVNAGKFTFEEVKFFGIIEILLGLIAAYYTDYGLLFWAIGFGFMHIVYGIYMHWKYER